jgi:hypothetical protein
MESFQNLNSKEKHLSFDHISKLLDYEIDDDEIEDVLPDFRNNIDLNIPMQANLGHVEETTNQNRVKNALLNDDMSLGDSQSSTRPSFEDDVDSRLADIPTAIHETKEMQESIQKLCLEFVDFFKNL